MTFSDIFSSIWRYRLTRCLVYNALQPSFLLLRLRSSLVVYCSLLLSREYRIFVIVVFMKISANNFSHSVVVRALSLHKIFAALG